MKGKVKFSIIIVVVFVILFCKIYYDNCTNEGILNKVIKRDGYILNRKDEEITVNLFIKPEWIPFEADKKYKIREELVELNGTKIILDNVWNRGNDIYFSFTTKYNMDYYKGNFMYNGIFNENGGFTTVGDWGSFSIYNNKQKSIEIGQTGFGPESDFSFGINPANYVDIKEGLYIDVSSFILYEYIKK